jgi:hypothetical protein
LSSQCHGEDEAHAGREEARREARRDSHAKWSKPTPKAAKPATGQARRNRNSPAPVTDVRRSPADRAEFCSWTRSDGPVRSSSRQTRCGGVRARTLVEHDGGKYSLVYWISHSADLQAVYDERGLQGGGYTWHGFIVHLLNQHAPEALAALEFDPEGSMFCAVSKDLAALRAVGAALAQLENLELVKRLALTVDVSEYD